MMLCARAGDELLALLLLGIDGAAVDDPDTLREISELGDRVSVTLVAADRERRLVERASRDGLTGLANRAGLYEALEIRLAGVGDEGFTLLFVDLDRFKDVNDAMGHQAGDQLLRAVAQRLQVCAPTGAVVARPGGDEFVLVVPGPQTVGEALARTLCQQLAGPVPVQGRSVVVGASIGMAHHPDHGRTASDLMRRADMAMYAAKADGGGRSQWFDPSFDERLVERTALLADLRHALKRGQFELHYQPRVDVKSDMIRSAEVLLRWRHPERGWVMPARFVGLLEEIGLIESVGRWVMQSACHQLAQWRQTGLCLDSIAVNVSTRQLHSATFVDDVLACVHGQALPPGDIELEITESVFVGESSGAIAALQRLHDAGLRVALDDFGTGYSSLSYLHKLPIDVLKIDRSFVKGLGSGSRTADALTTSVIALARALRMRLVAEGIETQAQADRLIELGCDELQGYLYSQPLAADDFAAFARQRAPVLAG